LEVLLVLCVLALAVLLIASPLLTRAEAAEPERSPERADLEAAKEAKYREIRDAELDYRTDKLSREDWRALDATLRAEAIELLRRIDALDR
jgi:type II secretory pathway component PulM